MKKLLAVFLTVLFLVSCPAAFADGYPYVCESPTEVYLNDTLLGNAVDISWCEGVPFAKAMTALGYTVTYDSATSTVCAKNDVEAYYFDMAHALAYCVSDGEKRDVIINMPPVAYNGTTYVSYDFFTTEMGLAYDRSYKSDSITLYDLTPYAQKLADLFKNTVDKYSEVGYDINKPQEYGLNTDFTTSIKCAPLGISVVGGGNFDMGLYMNLSDGAMAYSYEGDVSGIFNIIKLVSGKPLEEAKKVSGQVYMDKTAIYQKSDLTPALLGTDESNLNKWLKTEVPENENVFDLEDISLYKQMLSTYVNTIDLEGKEIFNFCDGVVKAFETILNNIKTEKKNNKLYMEYKLTADDLRTICLDFFGTTAFGYNIEDRAAAIENQKNIVNTVFDSGKFEIYETAVIGNGKIESEDASIDIAFTYIIPNVNVPIEIAVTGKSVVGKSSLSVSKEAPAPEDVFNPFEYYSQMDIAQ